MLALEAKRGVEATLERIYKSTGNEFDQLMITWSGSTAGIRTDRNITFIMFPGIDETKPVEQSLFNELIAYALHELGHKWFTQDRPWDEARRQHGAFVGALINGLEDPRIEQKVINSGYAPNAQALFGFLVNQVLRKSGYVEPDDFKNIPFMLAIEGRRLNGYDICVPSIVAKSPYAAELRWALKAAQKATDTRRIVKIAVELYERLKQRREELKQEKQQEQQQQPQDQQDQPGQQSSEQQAGDQQDQQDQQGGDANGSQASQNGAGDANASGEGEGEGDGNGSPSDERDDEPSDKPGQGGGHGNNPSHDEPVGRNPEPTDFINEQCETLKADADERRNRPHVGKPIYADFRFA
jgi:hypothetical protein